MTKIKSPFDISGPSIWTRDAELKRKVQGEQWAKKTQEKRGINFKNQVFQYSKASSGGKNGG